MALPSELQKKAKQSYGYGCNSGKRRYYSRSQAYDAMQRINADALRNPKLLRDLYRCERCGGWHLTSWGE